MPWTKLCDNFHANRKAIRAGPLAQHLYVCGLTYCARYLTDGFIDERDLRSLVRWEDDARDFGALPCNGDLAQRLVDAGLWERAEGGYRVHDYLDFQPSAERTRELREKRAHAGRLGGSRRPVKNKGNRGDASKPEANRKQTGSKPEANTEQSESKTEPRTRTRTQILDPNVCIEPNVGESPQPPAPRSPAGAGVNLSQKGTNVPNGNTDVAAVVAHYREVHPRRGRHLKPGHPDWKLIEARLREGFSVADLCTAINGNANDDWHRERGAHSIVMALRNAGKVESFIAAERRPKQSGVKVTTPWIRNALEAMGGIDGDQATIRSPFDEAQGVLPGDDTGRPVGATELALLRGAGPLLGDGSAEGH